MFLNVLAKWEECFLKSAIFYFLKPTYRGVRARRAYDTFLVKWRYIHHGKTFGEMSLTGSHPSIYSLSIVIFLMSQQKIS